MGQNSLNEMSTGERVIYAHARTARDMQDLRQQIYSMHRVALFERNLLISIYIIYPIIAILAFFFLSPVSTLEFVLLAILSAMFVVGGLLSNNISLRQIWMIEGLQVFYTKLAEDESVKFVAETMQTEKLESNGLKLAWHMIDELIARIQKGNHKPNHVDTDQPASKT